MVTLSSTYYLNLSIFNSQTSSVNTTVFYRWEHWGTETENGDGWIWTQLLRRQEPQTPHLAVHQITGHCSFLHLHRGQPCSMYPNNNSSNNNKKTLLWKKKLDPPRASLLTKIHWELIASATLAGAFCAHKIHLGLETLRIRETRSQTSS